MRDMPVACSLGGPVLGRRQSELRASVLAEAEEVQRMPDGYAWRFAHASDLFVRLGLVIDAERACCRFLRFTLRGDQNHGRVVLEITGPAGTVEFLESWVGPAS